MRKFCSVLTALAALVTIVTSLLFLFTSSFIPGVTPISLAVVMAGIAAAALFRYREGEMAKGRMRLIVIISAGAALLNILAAVLQLITK